MIVTPMAPAELDRAARPLPDAGVGALRTDRGNLPLDRLDVRASISGLVGRTTLTSEFVNVHDTALEATYVFPLPDRAAVTGMTMTADGRTVEAELAERGAARETYDAAVAAGQRASIAEEERPDVFTMRVGNIPPGERVTVELRLVGALPWEDGAATFRFPLVVAPRYVPGTPLPGPAVGDGHAPDTDAVPDASRITPPVLLPGFPNPLRLSIEVDIDPGGLDLAEVRSSLHTVTTHGNRISIAPDERADRDFVLRLPYAGDGSTLVCVPDGGDADPTEGTYQLTVLPPEAGGAARQRDVVLLLDRSGSMGGWKMVAARRAAARIVDTLTAGDRFCVVTFDHQALQPDGLPTGLAEASDRHRFRAVEHLAKIEARGGTELLAPLREGLTLLAGAEQTSTGQTGTERDRVLVLVTDGQVGNEDEILRGIAPLIGRTRVHAVGIDRAVNAGFLGRLASLGGGRCELVESEDRLDDAMEQIHRRIGSPVVTDLAVIAEGLALVDDSRSPARLPGIYPGVPLVISGRFTGPADGAVTVVGRTREDTEWRITVPARRSAQTAIAAQWARARLRDLEDRYAIGAHDLEAAIVATSLRFGVLCRFTAFVAVDTRVVTEGGRPHRVVQPVEPVSGWAAPQNPVHTMAVGASTAGPPPMAPPFPAPGGFAPVSATAPRPFASLPENAGPGAYPRGSSSGLRPGGGRVLGRDGGVRGRGKTPAPVPVRQFPIAEVVALEARRLREADGLTPTERRDMLADLAGRLGVLLAGQADPAYAPLVALVQTLTAGGDLETLWAQARRVLDGFTQPATAPEPQTPPEPAGEPERKAFWKR